MRGFPPSTRARDATCQLWPPMPSQRRVSYTARRTGARYLWEGGAALELEVCARRAALVVVSPSTSEGHFAGDWPLSFVARLWFDAPAAASNAKPAPLVVRVRRVLALAVSEEKTHLSYLLCARGMLRWS